MPLWKIKDKLYQKDPKEEDLFLHEVSKYNPASQTGESKNSPEFDDAWKQEEEKLGTREKKILKRALWILGIVLGIVLLTVIGFEIRRFVFNTDEVVVSIKGPAQASSGHLIIYEFDYKNSTWIGIQNAVLKVTYPEDFQPEQSAGFSADSPTSGSFKLGDLKKGETGKVILSGRAYSPKGALIYLNADLVYSPAGFSVQYEAKNQLGINIISAPLVLEVQAPQNIGTGDKVDYLASFRNDGTETIDSLRLKMDYPDSFSFSSGDPKPSEGNNIWYLGSLAPGQSGKITASGTLNGNRDEIKSVKAEIGLNQSGQFVSMSEENADTKISASPLEIMQTVNGQSSLTANAGDFLKFDLSYKNAGSIGLSNVIIKEKLESPVLDYSTLALTGGSFDIGSHTITWKASDIANLRKLESGIGGEIGFSIKVKNILPVAGPNDKNFVISSSATIDSPDIPTPISLNKIITSNRMDMKVNSDLTLVTKGFYTDPNISNSGPTPPKVGQATTYTIHWLLTNAGNDIKGTQVAAYLPTGATATGKIYPPDARFTYDERSNSVSWDVGNVSAGAGILSAPLEVSFQVEIKPSPDLVGQEAGLINESTVSATDQFTGENLKATAPERTTNLPEDSSQLAKNRVVN
jgi:hypothetical protein